MSTWQEEEKNKQARLEEEFRTEVKEFLTKAVRRKYKPSLLFTQHIDAIHEASNFSSEQAGHKTIAAIAGQVENFAKSVKETAEYNAIAAKPESQTMLKLGRINNKKEGVRGQAPRPHC